MQVIASSTVTSTGPTVVHGHVGCSPGTAIVGFPPGTATALHRADVMARDARAAARARYDASKAALGVDLSGKDLGGMTLVPGVYRFSSSAGLTGTLTLKGDGDFTFIVASTLTTASGAKVIHEGTGKILWLVGSSATLGTGSDLAGDVICEASCTLTTGSRVRGAIACLSGACTLDTATVG